MTKGITLLFLSFLLSIPILSHAQNETGEITGKVVDQEEAPVAYANVVLYKHSDSTLTKVEYTNDEGIFQILHIPSGKYWIDVTFVGLPPFRTQVLDLQAGQTLDLETIRMKKSGMDLEEVVVTAEKPLVELKADKMVFNVEESVNAIGNNALDLLRKSPGVVVDNNDNITMMGRSGVRIFIDGKPSPLRGEDLASYLRSMQSTEIEAIEIITNPGARYEAEGNAGIINIRLKKDKSLGANGNLNLGYSVGKVARYNGSVSGNYRNKTFNTFGSYSYNNGKNTNFMDLYREQLGFRLDQYADQGGDWQSHNFRTGVDFFLNEKSTLGVLVNGNLSNHSWGGDSRTLISLINSTQIDSILVASSRDDGDRDNLNFNLNYRFDNGEGRVWNMDADYGFFRNSGKSYQPNRYLDPSGEIVLQERINTTNTPTDIDIYTFKVDHERNLGKGKLSAGVKFSLVETDNTFEFFNLVDGDEILDIDRSNNFVYRENVNAAYLNYGAQLNEKWNFQVGLRAEQTNSTGDLTAMKDTENDSVERHYLDFFPSASLNYTASEKHSFQLSYGRRINRPSYQDLNPFENKLDELTFEKGNPFLQPEYTTNIQLTHSFSYRLNTTLRYSHTTDLITRQTDAAEGKAGFITWLNLADQYNYSINVSAPVSITDWWSSYGSLTAYYRENKGNFGDGRVIDLSAKAMNIYAQQTFQIPGDFTLELSGWYNSPSLWGGNFEMDAQWSMDAGLQKKILNDRGNLKLSVSDIFKTTNWHGVSEFGPLNLEIRGGWDSRRVSLNFSYLLGNTQVKGARKRETGLEEEQSRVKSND
jgi:iron complex outermembrane receptor protein